MQTHSRLDQELERKQVVQKESKKARVVRIRDNIFMDKPITGKSTGTAAPPYSNTEFQTPQLSGAMPVVPEARKPASTNPNIAHSSAQLKTRFTTAMPLASPSGNTARVSFEVSMAEEYNNPMKT